MKSCTIVKIGYTAGIYGNTGEYFSCFYTKGGIIKSFIFYGQYGVEERFSNAMKKKGYKVTWCKEIYGKLTRKDIPKNIAFSEHSALRDEEFQPYIKF